MFRSLRCVLAIVLLFVVAGCGSGGGGATSLFEDGTVSYLVAPLNSNFTSSASPATADSNAVTITISNTPYPNGIRKSPYTVKNLTVKYTKTNDSQVVLSEQINSPGPMISGGSISIPITIASSAIKNALLLQTSATGNFYVNISFAVEEDYSGKSSSYTNIGLGTIQFQ